MLSILLNKRFNRISRVIDMLCLFFGEDYTVIKDDKVIENVAEFSLHLQTQWRFRDNDRILLASRDIYEPYNKDVSDDWEYDLVGRPDELSSVFDVKSKKLIEKMKNTIVAESTLSPTNDILIKFSNGIIFEQFTPASTKDEEWRLINYANDLHIVCHDNEGKISTD